jgi:D-alanyl-D-alanine carboxypeptidase
VRRRLALLGAGVAGAVLGAGVMLSLPVPGYEVGPFPSTSPQPQVIGMAPVPTLLAWTPGRLPDGYAGAVRDLRSVRAVAVVRSGVTWLDAWSDASGQTQRPPKRFRIPFEVAAIDPGPYTDFVPPPDRPAIEGLAGGGAILGESGAKVRGIGDGGELRFGKRTLGVEGVLADELVGAHEAVVSTATGRGLGIDRPRYLLVLPRQGVPHRRVEKALRRALPAGIPLRVRAPGETPVFRHGDAVLPQVRFKELFGEFAAQPEGGFLRPDPRWVAENIRTTQLPILGEVSCHKKVIPLLRNAFQEIARRGLGDLIHGFAGCYSARFSNRDPEATLSHHSWGVAIDINASENPLGAEPNLDLEIVAVLEDWGFTWGGRWLVPDGMHFEFQRFPSVA